MEKVTKKFAELETLMRQAQPGTEEYEVGTQHLKYLKGKCSRFTVCADSYQHSVLISELFVILMQ